MTDKNLTDLCPELQGQAPLFITNCAEAGITVRIIVTWRDATDQNQCELEGLSAAKAGQSPHNHTNPDGSPCSLAYDFGVFRDGSYVTDGTDPSYAQAGAIAEGMGLVWGGLWSKPDYDHIELANWRQYGANS
jgi:hypothetical protein